MSITEQRNARAGSSGPVGQQLARARVAQGLSIDDVCRRTNIRPAVVHALENGDIGPSGGAVYARGHVRTLAQALHLDVDPLLGDFDASYGLGSPKKPVLIPDTDAAEVSIRPTQAPTRSPRWPWIMAALLVVVIIIAVVQLLVPEDKAPPKARTTTPTPAAAKPSAAVVKPPASPLSFPVPAEGVTLRIMLSTPSWLEISDQNGQSLIKRVAQINEQPVDLHAGALNATFGDAGAVTVSCNGHALGPIGAPGQVVTLILTRGSPQCPAA
jgi:cytoskeleton protein RodZ